jgi:hypothetical protein
MVFAGKNFRYLSDGSGNEGGEEDVIHRVMVNAKWLMVNEITNGQ